MRSSAKLAPILAAAYSAPMETQADLSAMLQRTKGHHPARHSLRPELLARLPAIAMTAALAFLAAGACPIAHAQEGSLDPAPASSGRFEILEHGGGFVRLDRQTGELSYCTIGESGLACRVAAEEREAYQKALSEFEERLSRLEGQSGAEAGGDTGGDTGTTSSKRQDRFVPEGSPPDGTEGGDAERELDQAMNLAERAMKRFFDVIREWQRELGTEGGQQQ
jgi:hypothetical protein